MERVNEIIEHLSKQIELKSSSMQRIAIIGTVLETNKIETIPDILLCIKKGIHLLYDPKIVDKNFLRTYFTKEELTEAHIYFTGIHKLECENEIVLAFGNSNITTTNCKIWAYDISFINASNCTVYGSDSCVILGTDSNITVIGKATANSDGYSQVNACGHSIVKASGYTIVTAAGESNITCFNHTQTFCYDYVKISSHDRSIVKSNGYCDIYANGESTIILTRGIIRAVNDNAVVIDRSDPKLLSFMAGHRN